LPVFDFGSPSKSVSVEDASKLVALYRHALESIFAFLPLSDLSRVLATSHEWTAAVGSMAPIASTCVLSASRRLNMLAVARSRLARHVRAIGVAGSRLASVNPRALDVLSLRCPNLRELRAAFGVAPTGQTRHLFQGAGGAVGAAGVGVSDGDVESVDRIRLPPRLHTLELHVRLLDVLKSSESMLSQLHTRVIEAVVQLRELRSLHLGGHSVMVPLVPLQSLPNLTDLELSLCFGNWPGHLALDERIQELRQMSHLRRMAVHLTDMQSFEKLMAEPTDALQWQDVGVLQVPWSNQVGRVLARLSCLNTLTLGCFKFFPTADFAQLSLSVLGNLASLTSLRLQMDTQILPAHAKRLPELLVRAAAEGALRRLLSLAVDSTKLEMGSDDFAAVLQGTPLLTSLAVINLRTVSLCFLAHAPPALRCFSLTTRGGVFGHLVPDLLPGSETEWRRLWLRDGPTASRHWRSCICTTPSASTHSNECISDTCPCLTTRASGDAP
jgi:hypothetical protein